MSYSTLNTLRPEQDGRHLGHGIFTYIFVNENVWNLIKISLKYVPEGQLDNKSTSVWGKDLVLSGTKLLCEPMLMKIHHAISLV